MFDQIEIPIYPATGLMCENCHKMPVKIGELCKMCWQSLELRSDYE